MNSKLIILLLGISIFTCSCNKSETIEEKTTHSKNETQSMETGLQTKTSTKSFEETINTLKSRIEEKGLRIFAVINHHENAQKNGFELAPTTLIIFGNPNVGAPLMQMTQSIGIDLPMKMRVSQNDNIVTMTFNDPTYLRNRHNLPDESEAILSKVSKMLNGITDV
jgi:uncharacterized protein (DUF302 family)